MKAIRPRAKFYTAPRRVKPRLGVHAVFIYKFRRETTSAEARFVPRGATRYMLLRVGLEAARISSFNRHCVITRNEILAALNQLRPRRNAIPMDGA